MVQAFDLKLVYDRRFYTMDFVDLLPSGAVILSGSVVISPFGKTTDTGAGMVDGASIIQGTVVGQWIKGGVVGSSYVVRFQAVCSDGSLLEADGQLTMANAI